MPSIADIANDSKALLQEIKSNTSAIKSNTATMVSQQAQLDTDTKNGFTNLAQGTQVLIDLGVQQNQIQATISSQMNTVICWLKIIANELCDIKRNTDKEVVLQTDISSTLHHIDDIGELVNSREAMEVANNYELEKKIQKCCPEHTEDPKPCFVQCKEHHTVEYVPIKTDWKPVHYSGGK